MSKQDEQYMALASHYATYSDMRSHHGTVIVLHGSIIAWGYNHERNYYRSKINNISDHPISCHAEMCALRDAIKRLKLDPMKDRSTFQRMRFYVARRSGDDYLDSKPCSQCYSTLKAIGVKRIMYSGRDNFCTMDVREEQICIPSSGSKIKI